MDNEKAIKPHLLWHYGATMADHLTLGRLVAKLCGQNLALSAAEQTLVGGLQSEIDQFRVAADKKAKINKKFYEKQKAKGTEEMKIKTSERTLRPYPTNHPPIHPTKQSINRSVCVGQTARLKDARGADGNANQTVDLAVLLEKCAAFSEAARLDPDNGGGAFFDGAHDAPVICAAVTGDHRSFRRWKQLTQILGEGTVREECFAFWRECAQGERPANPGAALNARLGGLAKDKEDAR